MSVVIQSPSCLSRSQFLNTFGDIYEDSIWVAEAVWEQGTPSDDLDELYRSMKFVVDHASAQTQLALMRAHPDLAGKTALAGRLSGASTNEQAGAGLDKCTPQELTEFSALNTRYKEKFGFPFIIAVAGLHRSEILEAFRARERNTTQNEFVIGITEIHKIAKLRIAELSVQTKGPDFD